ncbi:CPBP family intramembrane glutamic endopeptidase [Cellulomonas iranensis]|uniref:Membrane protease YdiL (CAAX protease family) n=1 Tax=Cellulomonas iranensis TaxID=76862 RepID=A0ABU0GJ22_9CELL|nr:type II CAAX endopeptidase family protein [Cellulomonas iranensis]MDQ0424899.1 membrane protease YdiL (CAAX protease family) [Cellulomonas iranensis]
MTARDTRAPEGTTPVPDDLPNALPDATLTPDRDPRRVLAWFVGTLTAVTAVALVPLAVAGADADAFNATVPLLSWAPTLAAFVAHLGTGRRTPFWRWAAVRPLRTGRVLRTAGLLVAVFVAVPAVTTAVGVATGLVAWRPTDDAAALAPLVLPFALVAMLTVTGEEIAWRGALHTTLARYGLVRATVGIGALWALWHLPLLLAYRAGGAMTGRDVVASMVNLLVAALVIGAARALSGSVWPAAWAHALLNTTLVYASSNLVTPAAELGDGAFWALQAVTWFVLGGAGALLLRAAARRAARA